MMPGAHVLRADMMRGKLRYKHGTLVGGVPAYWLMSPILVLMIRFGEWAERHCGALYNAQGYKHRPTCLACGRQASGQEAC